MKISVDIHVSDQPLPVVYTARNWEGVAVLLQSTEFKALVERAEFVTVTPSRGES